MEMSERDIQREIMYMFCAASDTCMPNYAPPDWWECDVLRVTVAGYWYEYEVKLSVSDFRADKRKQQDIYTKMQPGKCWRTPTGETENKHDLLSANEGRGPKQFWFCMPEGLIKVGKVPEWAGVFWVRFDEHGDIQGKIGRQAPNRKTEKLDKSIYSQMQYYGHGRYIDYIRRGIIK